jgi:hypothetical protein
MIIKNEQMTFLGYTGTETDLLNFLIPWSFTGHHFNYSASDTPYICWTAMMEIMD